MSSEIASVLEEYTKHRWTPGGEPPLPPAELGAQSGEVWVTDDGAIEVVAYEIAREADQNAARERLVAAGEAGPWSGSGNLLTRTRWIGPAAGAESGRWAVMAVQTAIAGEE